MDSLKNYFRGYAAHNKWANELIFDSLSEVSDEEYFKVLIPGIRSMHHLLNHVIIMDELWLSELKQSGARDDITSGDQILYVGREEMKNARRKIDCELDQFMTQIEEESFDVLVQYDKSGFHWPLWVEFAHVFRHQVNHRGQMSVLISSLGLAVPKLDHMFTPPHLRQTPVMEQLKTA
jgi:uncharacterized damage-inducible protein DinB